MSEEMTHVMKKSLAKQFKIPVTPLKGVLKKKDAIEAANNECDIHSKKQ